MRSTELIIHDVEQGSDEWHALRAGKPTASEFKSLVTTKGEASKSMAAYAIQLAADLYAGEPLDRWAGNEWSDRGHEMEDRARAFYENTFADREITQVGFCTDDHELYGASPDSMVQGYTSAERTELHSDGTGLLEIKCLKASRHVGVLVFYDRNSKLPSDYLMQPQGQMLVCERDWCDVLFWHPELPPLMVRQRPDDKIFGTLRHQIDACIIERNRVIEILNNA
jgi:hypothetical protein